MKMVAVAIAMVMVLGGPAGAGTGQNPELEDECGVGTHMVDEQVAPWLDLCAGWFQTLSSSATGAPEIKITLEVADLAAERPRSQYWLSWSSGGCGFTVARLDGGDDLQPGDAVSRLSVQCAPARHVPCPTPLEELGFVCSEQDDPLVFDVSDTFAQSGNRLSWTLRFAGKLAPYAKHHADGAVLRTGDAMTAVGVDGAPLIGPGRCDKSNDDPWQCRNQVSDWIPEGRNYVVGS
jgi:hypothetical protein